MTLPEYAAREIRERIDLARECPIDVYCSSQNPRWAWPYKLNASKDYSPAVSESCESLFIDGGYAGVTDSAELAHAAHRTDAEYVMARDLTSNHPVVGDDRDRHLTSAELTTHTAGFLDDLQRSDDASIGAWTVCHDATVVIPVQPPYEQSLRALSEPIKTGGSDPYYLNVYDAFDHFAVGGLQDLETVQERIDALRFVRSFLGDEVYIHALAPGTELELIHALREHSTLADSIDVSTPEMGPANNKIPDKSGTQHKHLIPTGTDVSTVRAGYAAAIASQLAFMLTPWKCDDEQFEEVAATGGEQATIDAYGGASA